MSAAYALAGANADALHGAGLALHLVNAALLYLAAAALLGRRPAALAGAVAFAVGAGACDALAWFAAISRPLSAVGQLVALNGLVRWRARPRLGGALIALGLLWQGLANEEVYGTALCAGLWLAWCALVPRPEPIRPELEPTLLGASAAAPAGCGGRSDAACAAVPARSGVSRRASLALAAAALAWVLVHYFALQRVPGGARATIEAGLRALPTFALLRSADVMHGLGAGHGLLPVLLLAPLVLARRPQAALLALIAWLASFVPFALEHPVPYRAYPTLAPTALCIAGCAHGLAALLAELRDRLRGPSRPPRDLDPWPERVIAALLALACLFGSAGPRAERLRAWSAATHEVAAIDALARERAWSPPEALPALVNLDTSTAAAVAYRLAVPVYSLQTVDFLDARNEYVPPEPPGGPPPRPWIGRRVDGSFGEIDPATYFDRPALPEVRLAGRARIARDLADARRLLAEAGLDGGATVVVEGPTADLADLAGRSANGAVLVLEPFTGDPATITGRMKVAVRADAPTILVVDSAWQFSHMLRIAADQMLFSGVEETRVLRLEARVEGEARARRAFFADALGFAVPLPEGEHVIELAWRRASPEELR